MRRSHCIGRASLGLALFGFGCTEPDAPTPEFRTCLDYDELVSDVPDLSIAYTTEHLDVHVADDRFLCAGSAIEYERHVQYVADELGIEIQRQIPVYAMKTVGSYCAPGASACATRDGVVFGTPGTVYHELAHGVACEIRTGSPPILAEGLAVTFEPVPNESMDTPWDFAEVHSGDFNMYYTYAGHFVRWLAAELGPERFADVYQTANYDDGVWAGLEAAYGGSLAEDYAAQAPFMWVPHRQCADMPLLEAQADGSWVFTARLDCDDASTLGPYEKAGQSDYDETDMYQSFLIEIPEPGTYRMQRPDAPYINVYYQRCLDEHPMTEQIAKDEWVDQSVFFTLLEGYSVVEFEFAGVWRIDITSDHGPPVDVWLTITPEP